VAGKLNFSGADIMLPIFKKIANQKPPEGGFQNLYRFAH
jgi:hypothetical protein